MSDTNGEVIDPADGCEKANACPHVDNSRAALRWLDVHAAAQAIDLTRPTMLVFTTAQPPPRDVIQEMRRNLAAHLGAEHVPLLVFLNGGTLQPIDMTGADALLLTSTVPPPREVIAEFRRELAARLGRDVPVLQDLDGRAMPLDEQQMAKLGWMRAKPNTVVLVSRAGEVKTLEGRWKAHNHQGTTTVEVEQDDGRFIWSRTPLGEIARVIVQGKPVSCVWADRSAKLVRAVAHHEDRRRVVQTNWRIATMTGPFDLLQLFCHATVEDRERWPDIPVAAEAAHSDPKTVDELLALGFHVDPQVEHGYSRILAQVERATLRLLLAGPCEAADFAFTRDNALVTLRLAERRPDGLYWLTDEGQHFCAQGGDQ